MTHDPNHCRNRAQQCLEAAEKAKTPKSREGFIGLSDRWKQLANELESAHPDNIAETIKRVDPNDMELRAKALAQGEADTK